MEQERVATIMIFQTQFSEIAPELEITPKKKDTHEEEVNRETQMLTQHHLAAFATLNTQSTLQKNAASAYSKKKSPLQNEINLNRSIHSIFTVTTCQC